MTMTKTHRILLLFHTFYTCEHASIHGISEFYSDFYFDVSNKTIYRDISFLKKAGILQAKYSKQEREYVPVNGYFVNHDANFFPPNLPENKTQRKYMEKIIRLCTMMVQMIRYEVDDPIKWYREKYPTLSDRTRQRDFKTLREIGYKVVYEGEDWAGPGGYYYNYPDGWYG